MSTKRRRPPNELPWTLDLGSTVKDSTLVEFKVWAPQAKSLSVKFFNQGMEPLSLQKDNSGYWKGHASPIGAGTTYKYVINESLERPDPASRYQPEGVHGPSQVIDPHAFTWTDQNWKGLSLEKYIIYELHVGTFSPESTFDGVIAKLPYLRDQIGVTAIELLPVAQCQG